jgi:histidinol-phosphate aminotransferase
MIRAVAGTTPIDHAARPAPGPRPRWLAALEPYVPVPELAPETIRLAFNESPFGPFPAAIEAIRAAVATVGRYPEQDGRLIAALAAHHGLDPEMIALGNGGDAVIGHVSEAFLNPGDEVITGWPSFPTYLTAAVRREATVTATPLTAGAVDLEAIRERIGPATKLIWICSPNNPTGGVVTRSGFARFLDAVPEHVLVVVDEAYFEFDDGDDRLDTIAEHVRIRPNVAALRTFSKLYGLAGLRVGYLAAPAPVVTAVGRSRHYFDINRLGAHAALASLAEPEEVARRRAVNARLRAVLEHGLSQRGRRFDRSLANFVAVDVGDADRVASRLLAAGVATRSLSALGAPRLLRVTIGAEGENERFLELLGHA